MKRLRGVAGGWMTAALGLVIFVMSSGAYSGDYYVATYGDDSNSGTTLNGPFRTVQKAASIMGPGDTCHIRGGTYRETVTPAVSGTDSEPVKFTSYNGEIAVVSGADILTGPWKVHTGSIYKAPVDWTLGAGKDQLFVDGKMVIEGRHPNDNANHPYGLGYPDRLGLPDMWLTFGDYRVTYNSDIVTSPTELGQGDDHWNGGIYVGLHNWAWSTQTADISDSGDGWLKVANKSGQYWFPDFTDNLWEDYFGWFSQGYITHHLNTVDQPGECYMDGSNVYVWLPDSGVPDEHVIEAKKRHLAFDLTGKDHIAIRDIRIFAASITMWKGSYNTLEGLEACYTSHYTNFDDARDGYIEDYTVQTGGQEPQKGETGIFIGGTGNTVKNSVIKYSAGAGLFLAGNNTTVTGNLLHDCGYAGTYVGTIFIAADWDNFPDAVLGGHRIDHNEMYNTSRSHILVSSKGSSQTTYLPMDISYNRMYNGMLTAVDGAGFWYSYRTTVGSGSDSTSSDWTQMHHNLIWDSWGYIWSRQVYPDEYTYNLRIHSNVMWHSSDNFMNILNNPDSKGEYTLNDWYFINSPGNSVIENNVQKADFDGGPEGLQDSDYPGGVAWNTGTDVSDFDQTVAVENVSLTVSDSTSNETVPEETAEGDQEVVDTVFDTQPSVQPDADTTTTATAGDTKSVSAGSSGGGGGCFLHLQ